jgi:hypothetical protein
LENLFNKREAKYWPKVSTIISEIGNSAKEKEVEVCYPEQETMLSSRNISSTIYIECIMDVLEGAKKWGPDDFLLPTDFRLPDKLFAELVNITLNIDSDKILTDENIKGARQRIRARSVTS